MDLLDARYKEKQGLERLDQKWPETGGHTCICRFVTQGYLSVCIVKGGWNLRRKLCVISVKSLVNPWTVHSVLCSKRSGGKQQLKYYRLC